MSLLLWLAAAACGALGSVLTFAVMEEVVTGTAADLVAATPEEAESIARAATVITVVLVLVLLAVSVVFAFLMHSRKNWARVGLACVAMVALVATVFGVGDLFALGGVGVAMGLLSLATVALIIAACACMFSAEANAHFRWSRM